MHPVSIYYLAEWLLDLFFRNFVLLGVATSLANVFPIWRHQVHPQNFQSTEPLVMPRGYWKEGEKEICGRHTLEGNAEIVGVEERQDLLVCFWLVCHKDKLVGGQAHSQGPPLPPATPSRLHQEPLSNAASCSVIKQAMDTRVTKHFQHIKLAAVQSQLAYHLGL